MAYYVRVATRGSAIKGTPRQAVDYITDGHDARRDPSYSDPELAYIARMDPGWKTDLEGGRVPLAVFGLLADEHDEQKLRASFENACQPYHDIRGTTGYKSITLTVPKEVSLYAEGHRQEAKAAINAAVKNALDRAFPNLQYAAVAAIHTRNQVGEIHYHVHVLVAKFARDLRTDRMVSLNSKAGGNGPSRVRDMKLRWQEGIEKEFRERLKVGIEQKSPRSPVSLVLPDGQRLEPLSRESRRLIEKQISPTYTETTPSGEAVTRHFRWSAMDDRIFEVASGARGSSAWDLAVFKDLFPQEARYASRYEARVRSLKTIGYLTPEGKITPSFRVHFAAHHGVLTPELQRVRLDLNRKLAREKAAPPAQPRPTQFWDQVQRFDNLRRRIERLGYSRDEVNTIFTRAEAHKPSPQTLQSIRATAEKSASLAPAAALPRITNVIRTYVDLHKSRPRRIYLVAPRLAELARSVVDSNPTADAAFNTALRPVIWLAVVPIPREISRLRHAVTKCTRLAKQQHIRRAARAETQKAYDKWREDFIRKPLADLKQQSQALQRPEQKPERPRLDQVLAAADSAKQIHVPDAFADQGNDLRRLAARLQSFGLRHPFTQSNLTALSPSQLRGQLAAARKAGLLDDGSAWALKGSAARNFAQEAGRQLEQTRAGQRCLEDQLIDRKGKPA